MTAPNIASAVASKNPVRPIVESFNPTMYVLLDAPRTEVSATSAVSGKSTLLHVSRYIS